MFKRKELRKASIGDYVRMSPNKVEIMINNKGYKQSSYSWAGGDNKRRGNIRGHSFNQNALQNNKINFEDAEVLYYKGDSFFSKDVAEVIPVMFKNENYNISAARDFIRRNKSYFVNKEDLVILSSDKARSIIHENSTWRCEKTVDLYCEKGVIDDVTRAKFIELIL